MMEHVSAPLARALSRIAPAPKPRLYRCENGIILSPVGQVMSIAQAKDYWDANLDLAREQVGSPNKAWLKLKMIGVYLQMAEELTDAIAQAEAYEPEPHVLVSPGSGAGVSEQGRAA